MNMQIVIPSKGRPDKIMTHELFPSAKVVVVADEWKAYAKSIGEDRLVLLPENLSGLTATRNFILENWKDTDFVFMADDDVNGIGRNHLIGGKHLDDEDYDKTMIKDPEYAEEIVYRLGEVAESAGAWICGFDFCKDKHHMGFRPFFLSGFVGCGMGFLKGHKLRFDPSCILYDDFDVSLMNAFYKRYCVVDSRYYLNAVDTAASSGGLSNTRNSQRYDECFKAMKRKWGHFVTRRHGNKGDNKREMQYNYRIKIEIPF